MAKKRSKGGFKGFGIADALIDLAGGVAMNKIAAHMESKYHSEAKGKINPYRASAVGIATGRLKSDRSLMRMGSYLWYRGSFHVTKDPPGKDQYEDPPHDMYLPYDPILYQLEERAATNDNRYAWRLNCEDGTKYYIYPEDFETRDEYNRALAEAKDFYGENSSDMETDKVAEIEMDPETFSEDVTTGVHCQVSRLDNGKTEGFWINNPGVKVGDIVELGTESGIIQGVVVIIDLY